MSKIANNNLKLFLLSAIVLALAAPLARAEDEAADLQEIIERLDRLERENDQLRREIRGLKRAKPTTPRREVVTPPPALTKPPSEVTGAPPQATEAQAGIDPEGGGFFIEQEPYAVRVFGYAQALARLYDDSVDAPAGNSEFLVRRARIDFLAELFDDYELFLEFDGAPEARTALVEAWLNWRVRGSADLQLRAGKFIGPFSAENLRSSRSLETVERYMALNSLFGLPALDTQTGLMLHGEPGEDYGWGYNLAVFNGNGSAVSQAREDNEDKEIQAKLTYGFGPGFDAGLALDYNRTGAQELSLTDLGFVDYVSVPVEGSRTGVGGHFAWIDDRWSLQGEGLYFDFDTPLEDHVGFYGGYLQPAYFLYGDSTRGLQLLTRLENVSLDADTGVDGDSLSALTVGTNWYPNGNVRLQANGILHYFDGPSTLLGFDDSRVIPLLLTELQFKF